MRFLVFLLCFLLAPVYSSFAAEFKAAVSIIPQKYLADKISGGRFEAVAVVPEGASPHNYEPRPQQMVFISKADVYFSIGIDFERVWLNRLLSANRNIMHIDLSANVPKYPITGEVLEVCEEDHDHSHDHGELDPHIWLSPFNMKLMAKLMAGTFSKIDPAGQEIYEKNLKQLLRDIDEADKQIKLNLKDIPRNAPFMVFHPSWGYFARKYNLMQVAVEIEGKEPKPAQLKELIQFAKDKNIKIVLASPQFSKQSAKAIASSIGGNVVSINSLAYDWDKNLIYVSEVIAQSVGKE